MRTLTVSLAEAIFACLVLQLAFGCSGESNGFRGSFAEPTSVADDKDGEPRALDPQEKRRDYAVLETCLIDLTDPKSPANKNVVKNGRVGTYIVLGPRTSEYDRCLSRERLPSLLGEDRSQMISGEIADEPRQRNSAHRCRWRTFEVRKAVIRIRDPYTEFKGTLDGFFAEAYWRKYPDS